MTTKLLSLGPRHARIDGFDLHANVVAPAGDRDRLARLCRYALRPPIAQDRIELTGDGRVWLRLRRRWSDGTTQLLFDPAELLERLAAITPRPRVNLILYHGVLAPRAKWRGFIVPDADTVATDTGPCAAHASRGRSEPCGRSSAVASEQPAAAVADESVVGPPHGRGSCGARLWADLMRRTHDRPINCSSRRGGARADPDHASLPSPVRTGDRRRGSPAQLG